MPWKMFAAPSGQCLKASAFIETNFSVNFSDLINVKASTLAWRTSTVTKRVPATFLDFWVPIYISGSLFSVFWLHSREN